MEFIGTMSSIYVALIRSGNSEVCHYNRVLSVGHLWAMQKEPKYWSTDLYESKSVDWADGLIYHRQFTIRWSPKCRSHRIPDKSSALSTYPLSARKHCLLKTNLICNIEIKWMITSSTIVITYQLRFYYHAGHICSRYVSGEGRAWESDCRGDNKFLLRTESPNGELRSTYGEVHGGMLVV